MTLRDLLRDVAPVTVREHGATQTLVNWDKIAARIVDVNGRHGISGALLPFSADGAVRVVDAFSRLADETQDIAKLDRSDRDALLGASGPMRSEEHTSELQSLMRISYAVFCLKNTKHGSNTTQYT